MDGYKAYLAAAAIVITGVTGYFSGDMTVLEAVTIVLNGLGLAAIRNTKALNTGA